MILRDTRPLTNLQMLLLKMYEVNVSDKDLKEISKMISEYFMKLAIDSANKVWIEKGYTIEKIEQIFGEIN
ncbi:MAG: hypothetical protein ABI723_18375 [Bacteroidia bacterium]